MECVKYQLGDICKISSGQGAPQGEDKYTENGTPFIKAGNLHDLVNGVDEYGIQQVSDNIISSHRLKLYPAGSVVFAKSGASCLKGYVYVLHNNCCVVSHLAILTPKEEGVYNPQYLCYYLRYDKPNQLVSDLAYPAISLTELSKFSIVLPSSSKQNAIVSELDKIQAALDNKKEQLKKLDELIQSKFYEMFGDLKGEPIELNKVIDVVSGLVNPNVEPYCSQYHIGPGNIVSGTGEIIDCKLAKDEGLISNKYAFKKGMVLYSKIRPNLNKVAIPKFDGICSADMYPLILKESVVDAFIWKLLSSQDFLVYAIKHSGRARMPKLNRETLLAYKFILPPLPLQQAFAAYVEKVEQAKAIVNQEIAHLQELLNSRMDYYFRK